MFIIRTQQSSYTMHKTSKILSLLQNKSSINLNNIISTYAFCNQNKEAPKIETVGFKKNTVNNYNKLSYLPKQRLKFINGRCLLYRNNRTFMGNLMRSSLFIGPMSLIAYLIVTNPFADVFPAAIPILAVLQLFILKLWTQKIKRNQNLIKQIYLLENGETTQIYFNNKTKRRLFGQPISRIYYHSLFVNPDFQRQSEQSLIVNHEMTKFPSSEDIEQNRQINMSGYSWIKYYSNGQNYIIIPKNAEYNNIEILSQIFEGKIIITNQKN